MDAALQWGLDCIRLIQRGGGPPLTAVMRIITELGSVTAYLILLPFIYWCVDEKKGLHLGIMVLVSVGLNLFLKLILGQPRPFFEGYDPSLGMIPEKLGGFPSGHAQNSLVMWMIIASWGKKKWQWCAAALLCVSIGFSRVYLGVHFPTDVFGGWIIGGLLLAVYFLTGKKIESLLAGGEGRGGGSRAGLIACAAVSFLMILYRPSAELIMPAAMILGLGGGYSLCRYRIGFTASALEGRTGISKYLVLLVRYLLGITVLSLLFVVTEKIAAAIDTGSGNYRLFIFLRFALLALWVSAGAPWLFRFLRLAEKNGN